MLLGLFLFVQLDNKKHIYKKKAQKYTNVYFCICFTCSSPEGLCAWGPGG